MSEKRKKVILISLDALAGNELPELLKLPHFSRIIGEGAVCPDELSVCPSLTFPSHASIATGCRPGTHGVVNNYLLDPSAPIPKWNFYAKNLKRRALWDYAADAGKTVLSLSWPVSAGANIRYSMPEMTPAKPKIWNDENYALQLEVFRDYGTPDFAIETFHAQPELPQAWFFGRQPVLDECMSVAFEKALRTHDFDIAMLHIYGMDDAKHHYGAKSAEARAYLPRYDAFLGRMLDYARERCEAGENVTLMVTGDHSQLDVSHAVYGNVLLAGLGLCRFKDGLVSSWDAYLDSCDGLAYIYLRDGAGADAILPKIRAAFAGNPGVKSIWTGREAAPMGCDPGAALVLEAAPGYGFEGGWRDGCGPDGIAENPYRALHGYPPELPDYQTMFLCWGPDVRHGVLPRMCITDITPTICSWMGLPADPMDGRPVDGLFREEA